MYDISFSTGLLLSTSTVVATKSLTSVDVTGTDDKLTDSGDVITFVVGVEDTVEVAVVVAVVVAVDETLDTLCCVGVVLVWGTVEVVLVVGVVVAVVVLVVVLT